MFIIIIKDGRKDEDQSTNDPHYSQLGGERINFSIKNSVETVSNEYYFVSLEYIYNILIGIS